MNSVPSWIKFCVVGALLCFLGIPGLLPAVMISWGMPPPDPTILKPISIGVGAILAAAALIGSIPHFTRRLRRKGE